LLNSRINSSSRSDERSAAKPTDARSDSSATETIDFLLIGGGQACVAAARQLRDEGVDGSILILGGEAALPYRRPPLSKQYLAGSENGDRLLLAPAGFYAQKSIGLRLGTPARAVLPADHAVVIDGGERIAYCKLLIATGGNARNLDLPGAALAGVHRLHTRDDADAVRAAAAGAKRAVVVGGSFLGLEVAATLAAMGLETVMLERGASLMPRLNAPEISAFLLRHCLDRGLQFVPATDVAGFEGDGTVRAVVTAAGARWPCDLVVLCVGIAPAVGFLAGSGIALDDGIVVDERLRTNVPDIFAAGDVANFYDPVFAKRRRLEHEDSALKQGRKPS